MLRIPLPLALAISLACSAVLAQQPPKQEATAQGPCKESVAKSNAIAAPAVRPTSREGQLPALRASAAQSPSANPAAEPAVPAAGGVKTVRKPSPEADASDRACLAWHKRATIRLNHAPAGEMAKALKELFAGDGAVLIVPELVSNTLLISAVPGALEEVIRVAEGLDRAPAMVAIELLIVQVKSEGDDKADVARPKAGEALAAPDGLEAQLRALKKRGQVEVLCRPCLATCSQQSAFFKVGRREPRVTGSATSRAGSVNSTTLENVGMTVSVTPRVGDDKTITMEIDVDDSRLGPLEEGAPVSVLSGGETIRTPRVETVSLHSTVSMRDGQTVLVGRRVEESKSGRIELVIFVSAHATEPKKGK